MENRLKTAKKTTTETAAVGNNSAYHVVMHKHLYGRSALFAKLHAVIPPSVLNGKSHKSHASIRFIPAQKGKNRQAEELALLNAIDKYRAIGCVLDSKPFSHAFFHALPRHFLLCRYGSGTNNIAFEICEERRIAVKTAKGASESVAEHTFALLLALAKKIPQQHHRLVDELQKPYSETSFLQNQNELRREGFSIKGKTLCILGWGEIGKEVARIAIGGFAMRVLVLIKHKSPNSNDNDGAGLPNGGGLPSFFHEKIHFFTAAQLPEMLRQTDILSLHLPLNAKTRHIVNKTVLKHCKQGLWLLNTARGQLVEEAALYEGLKSGKIAGAALDVFDGMLNPSPSVAKPSNRNTQASLKEASKKEGGAEPLENPPPACRGFLHGEHFENLALSPHVAGHTKEANEKIARLVLNHVRRFLQKNGKPLQ